MTVNVLKRFSNGKQLYLWVFLSLAALCFLVYGEALHYGFVSMDDEYFILNNPDVQRVNAESLRAIFTSFGRDYHYVPLFYLYFAVVNHFWGPDPFYFHLFSLLFHIANAFLVFYLLSMLSGKKYMALFAAFLFAVHPLQVEAVCWVAAVKTPISASFFLLGAAAYYHHRIRYDEGRVALLNIFSVLCFVFFICAMLVKTTAVTLPLLLLAMDYVMAPVPFRNVGAFLKKYVPGKLFFLPAILVLFVVNQAAAAEAPFTLSIPYNFLDHVAIIGHNVFFYMQKSLLPMHLSLYYNPPMQGGLFQTLYGLKALIGYSAAAVFLWGAYKNRLLFLAASFFFIPLCIMLDTSLFIKDIILLTADRYYYLSAAGFFFLAGWGMDKMAHALKKTTTMRVFGLAGAVSLYAYCAHEQIRVWKDSLALMENTVRHEPNPEFHIRLGREYLIRGYHDKAYENFQVGFSRMDANVRKRVHYTMGLTPGRIGLNYGRKDMHQWAQRYFEMEVKMHPDSAIWWANLGQAYIQLGDTVSADSCFREAVRKGFHPAEALPHTSPPIHAPE
ncbi:MAG: hypothetical protein KatS3mg031_2622 [Chitinophagales bacterium]|nr:MAG: hypothetical protein KatS3mg031_2622 [Chitinophagales bacterium]